MKLFKIVYKNKKLGRNCTKYIQANKYEDATQKINGIILGQEVTDDEHRQVIRTHFRQEQR